MPISKNLGIFSKIRFELDYVDKCYDICFEDNCAILKRYRNNEISQFLPHTKVNSYLIWSKLRYICTHIGRI